MLIQCYLWLITARAHCWLMSNLLSTKIPRTFYARFCLLFGFFYPEDSWPAIHLYPHILSISPSKSKSQGGCGCSLEGESGTLPILLPAVTAPTAPIARQHTETSKQNQARTANYPVSTSFCKQGPYSSTIHMASHIC